jgi:C4-dicarboxylate-binding protein DctP
MKNKLLSIIAIAMFGIVCFIGCNKSKAPAAASGKLDMTAFSLSIASPLPPEDAAVDWQAKSSNPKKVVWKHGTVSRNLDENPAPRAERQFFIEMKKRLGDKIEIQLFPNGSLGASPDQILGGIQARSFESYGFNPGAFAEYTKAFLPLDVMYLIPNIEAGAAVCAGEPGELMRQKCIEDTGLNVLVYPAIGMRQITNTKRPIHTPADMKGLKIRIQSNPLHIMAMKAFGAVPTPIAYAELFTSLQQKVVDGQENPVANIFDMNYGEVQTYMTLSNHMYTPGGLVANDSWIKEQSAEFQDAVRESMKLAQAYAGPETMKVEARLLEELGKQMEITSLTEDEFKQFQEISKPIWAEAAKTIGEDYFNTIRSSIERVLVDM